MVCGALTEAHAIGLIHRDIKPANIMLCTQGGERDVVKLLDFGLVKEFEVDRDVKLTGASTSSARPQYMAPESILAPDSVDARTDIYALGAVAYFLLAGVDVFDGKSIVEVCSQHLHQEPEPLSARGRRGSGRARSGRARLPRQGSRSPPSERRRTPAPARSVRRRALGQCQSAGLVARVPSRTSMPREAEYGRRQDHRRRWSTPGPRRH